MYTCCCGAVTESTIRETIKRVIEAEQRLITIEDLQQELPAGCFCGCCREEIEDMIDEANKHA